METQSIHRQNYPTHSRRSDRGPGSNGCCVEGIDRLVSGAEGRRPGVESYSPSRLVGPPQSQEKKHHLSLSLLWLLSALPSSSATRRLCRAGKQFFRKARSNCSMKAPRYPEGTGLRLTIKSSRIGRDSQAGPSSNWQTDRTFSQCQQPVLAAGKQNQRRPGKLRSCRSLCAPQAPCPWSSATTSPKTNLLHRRLDGPFHLVDRPHSDATKDVTKYFSPAGMKPLHQAPKRGRLRSETPPSCPATPASVTAIFGRLSAMGGFQESPRLSRSPAALRFRQAAHGRTQSIRQNGGAESPLRRESPSDSRAHSSE